MMRTWCSTLSAKQTKSQPSKYTSNQPLLVASRSFSDRLLVFTAVGWKRTTHTSKRS
jgi:hypothetical protein